MGGVVFVTDIEKGLGPVVQSILSLKLKELVKRSTG